MIQLPATLQDFINLLLTNVVFLGAISAIAVGLLMQFMANMVPGGGYEPAANWKRVISLIMPFLVVFAAFGLGLVFSYVHNPNENTIYNLLVNAITVIGGQQVAYTTYKGVKGLSGRGKISDTNPKINGQVQP